MKQKNVTEVLSSSIAKANSWFQYEHEGEFILICVKCLRTCFYLCLLCVIFSTALNVFVYEFLRTWRITYLVSDRRTQISGFNYINLLRIADPNCQVWGCCCYIRLRINQCACFPQNLAQTRAWIKVILFLNERVHTVA